MCGDYAGAGSAADDGARKLTDSIRDTFFPSSSSLSSLKASKEGNSKNDTTYKIKIMSETLGLTVENVLERTIIRTVIPNQAAYMAGAKVGSLITQVGRRPTTHLTHFECIDELRQSKRPLELTLKVPNDQVLEDGRSIMLSLIDDSSSNSKGDARAGSRSSLEALSERFCNLLLLIVIGWGSENWAKGGAPVAKIIKDYVKRCGGVGGGDQGGISREVEVRFIRGDLILFYSLCSGVPMF